MLNLSIDKWIKHDARISRGRRKEDKKVDRSQLIGCRARLLKHKYRNTLVIRFLLGKFVLSLIDLKQGDYVNIYIHKKNDNLVLIKKADPNIRKKHKISYSAGSNFMTTDIMMRSDFSKFITDQTFNLNYDISDQNILLIDLSNIKRK